MQKDEIKWFWAIVFYCIVICSVAWLCSVSQKELPNDTTPPPPTTHTQGKVLFFFRVLPKLEKLQRSLPPSNIFIMIISTFHSGGGRGEGLAYPVFQKSMVAPGQTLAHTCSLTLLTVKIKSQKEDQKQSQDANHECILNMVYHCPIRSNMINFFTSPTFLGILLRYSVSRSDEGYGDIIIVINKCGIGTFIVYRRSACIIDD